MGWREDPTGGLPCAEAPHQDWPVVNSSGEHDSAGVTPEHGALADLHDVTYELHALLLQVPRVTVLCCEAQPLPGRPH